MIFFLTYNSLFCTVKSSKASAYQESECSTSKCTAVGSTFSATAMTVFEQASSAAESAPSLAPGGEGGPSMLSSTNYGAAPNDTFLERGEGMLGRACGIQRHSALTSRFEP